MLPTSIYFKTVCHDGEERRDDDSPDPERPLPEADPHEVDLERGGQQEEASGVVKI